MSSEPDRVDLLRLASYVNRDIALMVHYREAFDEFRSKVLISPEQEMLRFGHFFIAAMFAWYTNAQLVALRAVTDVKTKQLNLGTLLKRVKNAPTHHLAMQPASDEVADVIKELTSARKSIHEYVSQRVAHRDPDSAVSLEYNAANELLERIDDMLQKAWVWIHGPCVGRPKFERDPFWVELLFSQGWLPPTNFNERLALSRDLRLVTQEDRRDFTPSEVWGRRPTEDELSKMGMSRSEWEAYRSSNQ